MNIKKYLFLCIAFFSLVNLLAQTKGQKKKEFYVSSLPAEKKQFYDLFEQKLYDSVIVRCKTDFTNNAKSYNLTNCYSALAIAYAYLGLRDSAYYYAFKVYDITISDLDRSGQPFTILSDYIYAYPLAIDKELEHEMDKKFSDYYLKQDYPLRKIGLELYRLSYQDQKIRYQLYFNEAKCHDDSLCIDVALKQFNDADSEIQATLLKLLQDHKGYFSKDEIGPAASQQLSLLIHYSDLKTRELVITPMLKKAFEQKQIEPMEYVNQLGRTAQMQGMEMTDVFKLKDSLCATYKCYN